MSLLRGAIIASSTGIVASLNVSHTGYEKHWWWDNVGHFFSGLALGMVLPDNKEVPMYLAIAAGWECFEWKLATMKLYELHDSIPEGPRSMGFEHWDFDHQVEDTMLDTIMGYYGVRVAQAIKRRT